MPHNDFQIAGTTIAPGETADLRLKVSESYTGDDEAIAIRVIRAQKHGPVVFICAAVHGDEINGTGIIRQLMFDNDLELTRGTAILIPIVNSFGFEANSRYLPDRRDLNRSFPGSQSGSLASRIADSFFREIIQKCDYGIDLHTAAVRRTNYPNIRGDLSMPGVRRIARAFGCELMVNGKGPAGSLRREACRVGCPTIILEAGEVWKIEPGVVDVGVRGVKNVLIELDMLEGEIVAPHYQTRVEKTYWIRSEVGGILTFHVGPGDIVEDGQPIATNVSVVGDAQTVLIAPAGGVVLGMATLPAVKPGEPVCHIAMPKMKLSTIQKKLGKLPAKNYSRSMRRALATNISVHPPSIHDLHWREPEPGESGNDDG
ncbi:MAG: succinate dehydrogenase [Phycisphaerales bacterium]|nr:MAG: succinate dehydrogenase [Phycisphaerales bacterium]